MWTCALAPRGRMTSNCGWSHDRCTSLSASECQMEHTPLIDVVAFENWKCEHIYCASRMDPMLCFFWQPIRNPVTSFTGCPRTLYLSCIHRSGLYNSNFPLFRPPRCIEGTKSAVPRPVTGHGRAFNCYLPRHGLSNTLFLSCVPRDGANRPGLIIYIINLVFMFKRYKNKMMHLINMVYVISHFSAGTVCRRQIMTFADDPSWEIIDKL